MRIRVQILWYTVVLPLFSGAFLPESIVSRTHTTIRMPHSTLQSVKTDMQGRVGDILGDLPTPRLLLELSLAEGAVEKSDTLSTVDEALGSPDEHSSLLEGALFIHTTVTDTSSRDAVTKEQGSGKSRVICQLDMEPNSTPGGAYLGIGLANHLVGGYYWARGMGMGASLPAHGVYFSESTSELYWKERGPGQDAKETTEESSNSNDGKRSEWADFVMVGDTVQLVPEDISKLLRGSEFATILGVRRIGRPLGADPIVEKVWVRANNGEGFVAQSQ